ncbi:hypothetical protein EKO04_011435 [Ascochyta lentis]|uniref:Uncharacterized protein n=1 Tax=Ascochyta lentis TaxID=205686 RepID=A0A8H7IV94_9PLEO|nr:hypothetical protein EKO04_011435 [Ascochyta lentis]
MSDVAHHPLVTPRALTIALLETHRKTLETLYLDFHHYYDLSDPELREEIEDAGYRFDESYCTYPSFRAFERLAHLTIEFEKLVHVWGLGWRSPPQPGPVEGDVVSGA